MALKICNNGHLTGTRACHCSMGGDNTIAVKGPSGGRAMDKRVKREITKAIRESGAVPVRDL